MDASYKDDRRKHSRVGFTTKIEIILNHQGQQVILEAGSKDLSLKGIFGHTDQQFTIDSPCSVNVYLTGGVDEIKLAIEGRIVRQTESGIGIVFESMDVDTYTHLKNIVLYNSGSDPE